MGSIIKTYGYIEPMTVIILNDLQPDGTVLKLRHELHLGKFYRIMYFDKREKAILTIKGRYLTYINDDYNHYPGDVDSLVIDISSNHKSRSLTIRVEDIKSIESIEDL